MSAPQRTGFESLRFENYTNTTSRERVAHTLTGQREVGDPRGGGPEPKICSKLPENCMILKKNLGGLGVPGPGSARTLLCGMYLPSHPSFLSAVLLQINSINKILRERQIRRKARQAGGELIGFLLPAILYQSLCLTVLAQKNCMWSLAHFVAAFHTAHELVFNQN